MYGVMEDAAAIIMEIGVNGSGEVRIRAGEPWVRIVIHLFEQCPRCGFSSCQSGEL
jgi:hypothetical protein